MFVTTGPIMQPNCSEPKRRKRKRLAANRAKPLELPDGYFENDEYAQRESHANIYKFVHRFDDDREEDLRVEYDDEDDLYGNVQALELPQ